MCRDHLTGGLQPPAMGELLFFWTVPAAASPVRGWVELGTFSSLGIAALCPSGL